MAQGGYSDLCTFGSEACSWPPRRYGDVPTVPSNPTEIQLPWVMGWSQNGLTGFGLLRNEMHSKIIGLSCSIAFLFWESRIQYTNGILNFWGSVLHSNCACLLGCRHCMLSWPCSSKGSTLKPVIELRNRQVKNLTTTGSYVRVCICMCCVYDVYI